MVRALHAAGLEVILDVVYNHTAEGNQLGPTLSLKGIDNASYYRLGRRTRATTWTSPAAATRSNMRSPQVLQLIMDSLRYWVLEMHVDGFRFDLASALARELYDVDRLAAFFDIIHQDPVLSQVKLIAEPWDLGEGGYQVGNFPVLWTEWNGKYRDSVRRFWRGDGGTVSELATRLAGSNDLYAHSGRQPYASINFVTAHDGFTLHDLVSYNEKHNEANGEDNRDGENNNLSWNCGVEGPTDDPAINATARAAEAQPPGDAAAVAGRADDQPRRRARPHAAGQQQRLLPGQRDQLDRLGPDRRAEARSSSSRAGSSRFRLAQPALRRRKYFQGRSIRGGGVKDVAWLAPDGREMTDEAWNADFVRSLGMLLAGDAIEEVERARRADRRRHAAACCSTRTTKRCRSRCRRSTRDQQWQRVFDTADPDAAERAFKPGGRYPLQGRSLAVFKVTPPLRERRRAATAERTAQPELVDARAGGTGRRRRTDGRRSSIGHIGLRPPTDDRDRSTTTPRPADDPLWYKDAIIYQAHVESFFDSNNDGVGDFQGLTQKLDYLQGLGITCLWLLPFFPSPLRDDGYDIADYLNVHPSYGTLDDFKAFVRAAHERAHQGPDRARHQPHLGPASLVPARAPCAARIARARVLRLERHRQEVSRDADHLFRYRKVQLDLRSGRRAVLLAPLLLASARPQPQQSGRRRRGHRRDEVLARSRRRRAAARRGAVSVRPRRHHQREPAGDARRAEADAARARRRLPEPHAARRGEPVAGRRPRRTSATATNATWRFTSR